MSDNESSDATQEMGQETVSENVARVEAEAHDEIDNIMAEIERIKSTMVPAAPVAVAPPVSTAEAMADGMGTGEAEPVVNEVDFGQANTEAPIEETLGSVGVEESSGGVFDEAKPEPEQPEPAMVEEMEEFVAESPVEAAPEVPKSSFVPRLVSDASEKSPVRTAPSPGGSPATGSLSMTLTGSMKLALKYDVDGQEVTLGFDSQFLHLTLADGTEFKIPVGRDRRKVA